MRISLFGDSLTAGTPGVSSMGALVAMLPEHRFANHGRAGDTVASLYRRIAQNRHWDLADVAVLWVGVNDVLARVSCGHSILKRLMRQPWARSGSEFRDVYGQTLELLRHRAGNVLVVSPLLIGEDLSNPWNRELGVLRRVVAAMPASFGNVHHLDVRPALADRLRGRPASTYIPRSVASIGWDALLLRTPARVDAVSSRRGLRVTLDGVHLNSMGAEAVARAMRQAIMRVAGSGEARSRCRASSIQASGA